jgi:phytoene synthase
MQVIPNRVHFTNARATNFYYSFIFLSPEKRRAIEAVYAFARRADDAVDASRLRAEAVEELAHCRECLAACYGAGSSGDSLREGFRPELGALAEAVQRFQIPRRHFEDLILGFEMDLSGTHYATFDDLLLYCYRVASTIGLIAIEIFGYRNPRSRDYAIHLGTALQLVNILRDLHSDLDCGRLYLPDEDLRRFGVEPQDLLDGQPSDRFTALMHFEADRARHYFKLARQALPREDRRSMVPAEIMAAIYWRLLGRIRQRGGNASSQRVGLSRPLKFWTALSVFLGTEWFRRASTD